MKVPSPLLVTLPLVPSACVSTANSGVSLTIGSVYEAASVTEGPCSWAAPEDVRSCRHRARIRQQLDVANFHLAASRPETDQIEVDAQRRPGGNPGEIDVDCDWAVSEIARRPAAHVHLWRRKERPVALEVEGGVGVGEWDRSHGGLPVVGEQRHLEGVPDGPPPFEGEVEGLSG